MNRLLKERRAKLSFVSVSSGWPSLGNLCDERCPLTTGLSAIEDAHASFAVHSSSSTFSLYSALTASCPKRRPGK